LCPPCSFPIGHGNIEPSFFPWEGFETRKIVRLEY
jgi:hypothetical protein